MTKKQKPFVHRMKKPIGPHDPYDIKLRHEDCWLEPGVAKKYGIAYTALVNQELIDLANDLHNQHMFLLKHDNTITDLRGQIRDLIVEKGLVE